MSVYIIAAQSEGLVKIGYALRPYGRLSNLRVGSPVELVLAAIIPGSRANEQQLHAQFAKERAHGEWFYATSEICGLIRTYRVTEQSQRRRPQKAFGPPLPFDHSANERWLRAYDEQAALGRPVSRVAMDRFMATYRPDQAAAA